MYWSVGELELDSLGGLFTSRVPCAAFSLLRSLLAPRCSLNQVLPFLRGILLSDLTLANLLTLLCTQGTPVSGRARRSWTVSGTHSSTVLLQQAASKEVLRQVRVCFHAGLPCVELSLVAAVQVGPMARLVR